MPSYPIGGNVTATLQANRPTKTPSGLKTHWEDIMSLNGFLDYASGDSSLKFSYHGNLEQSTHTFICDYVKIPLNSAVDKRLIIDGNDYIVLHIDDPMGLHEHLEIALQFNEVMNNVQK